MRAAPATRATTAMRRFRNSEIADGIVYHNRAGSQFRSKGQSSSLALCPDARRKRERRIVSLRHSLLFITYNLNREDRSERLFLK